MSEREPLDPSPAGMAGPVLERNAGVVVAALRGGGPAPLPALLAARTAAGAIEDATRLLVLDARRAGHTWQEIGQLLSISRQAAQQRFAAPGPEDPGHELTTLGRRAAEIVEQLRAGDWAAATADWDDTLRAKLPITELTAVWAKIAHDAGELEGIGRPVVVRRGPYRIADVPLVFARGPMKARVTFGLDGAVAGLFILLPDAA